MAYAVPAGHAGKTLERSAHVDTVINHPLPHRSVRVAGALPESFVAKGAGYAVDARQVYHKGKFLSKDVADFQMLPSLYARTRATIYYDGKPVAGADAATFAVLERREEQVDARDAHACYLRGPRENYGHFTLLAQRLTAANVDRIPWGANWPHPNSGAGNKPTDVTPLWPVDDGLVLNGLPAWAPDATVRKKILVDNPARRYGF